MRISELSRRSGVPATALRFYESVGLIVAARGTNGYRDYDDSAVDRLTFIHGAKQLDLSLPEIVELLNVVEAESCTQVRETLRPKLDARLRDVDERLAVLMKLRERLVEATDHVAACPDSGDRCRTECVLARTEAPCVANPLIGRGNQ
ncbi:MerR family transcriptional regulator [Microbacterium sp. LRZ72]|uniref:MerR family transcriptional regulator n=1 Tax=Microbacterium sp. LRZ72 TaxID=2942481 RepID=UPI0029B0E4A9|nr:MerR family transcriptional regulator [Microbacterium sp. LRZ72]MDX2377600.1 MerR family transcriptional regulator [Microbacterium sp. LRZ72]